MEPYFKLGFTTALHNPACHPAAVFMRLASVQRRHIRDVENARWIFAPKSKCIAWLQKWHMMAGFNALASRWRGDLMAIHISACMKWCHGSWRPLTAHLNFTAAAKFTGTILCPSLSESYHSFFKDAVMKTHLFQSRCDDPFHMTVISNRTRLPSSVLCYFSGECAFSICRHCWIWHLSLSGINYWSSMLSWLLSWMLRILWYL